MYKKFITATGSLNANITRKITDVEFNQLRKISSVETASLNTVLYCIHNVLSCKKCEHCGNELDVENFKVGWKESKRFCSIKCKAEFDSTKSSSNEILNDYSLVLDKNGNPSSGKLARHMNAVTVKDLQEKTGLLTDDVSTLLYASMNKDFVAKNCNTCNSVMPIHNFQMGYREDQQFCSYECKDKNSVYRSVLRSGKEGISRYDSPAYMDTRMRPWFTEKQNEVFTDFGVNLISTFDEYLQDKKNLKFSCHTCGFSFVNDMSFSRSLFCKICNPRSRQQTELTKFIQSFGFDVELDTRKIIAPKEIDIWIPSLNIGIEYDGFYHHRNKDDSKKYKLAEEKGIRIIRVFEDEYKYKQEIVLSRIESAIGKTENKIYARQCVIVELNSETSSKFLEKTHIQGNINASIRYGLMYDNELISVMTFSKPRYDTTSEWELIRFSNKLNTIVIGGASKLFKHFIKMHTPKNIVSYCDVRYGTGNIYKLLGFVETGRTQSNYFYYKNGIRHSRVKFQKHKLEGLLKNFNPLISESENMDNNGYIKIFDNGNKVFKWNE